MTRIPAIHSGVVIADAIPLAKLLAPIQREIARCYWLIDTPSGPFRDALELANENSYGALSVSVEPCGTSSTCWRPETLPARADKVHIDEWTYIFGLQCDESDLARRITWLMNRLGHFDADFFDGLASAADVFIMHGDGWWEVYSAHRPWTDALCAAISGSVIRSISAAGTPL